MQFLSMNLINCKRQKVTVLTFNILLIEIITYSEVLKNTLSSMKLNITEGASSHFQQKVRVRRIFRILSDGIKI